ncbi:hypothetical protein AB4027_01790 [Alkalibacterium putridalgicola]|uniref:hypothetical protein n=1 Tax=Alkalibacterium putridalgicola TaxID=426703 RepID=UPI0034CFCF25
MSTKKSFQILCVLDLLLIGVYVLYVVLPENYYPGYYPIGIVQITLLTGAVISLSLYLRNRIMLKEIGIMDGLLLAGYIFSIMFMAYGVFIWYAAMPS